jgi:threonyl-tRNA synthetase
MVFSLSIPPVLKNVIMLMPNPSLETMRHSAAHLFAAAITELYPDVKLGVGPVVEHGFYYDVLTKEPIAPESLKKIEQRMREIRNRNVAFTREEMPIDAAITFFRERGQDFKVELLTDLKTKGTTKIKGEEAQDVDAAKPSVATVYHTGTFVDLCRGPHVENTKQIGAFTLTKIAGAYWRGSEKNPMLTRVYGLAFATQAEIDAHLTMLAEAERRDHRKLGVELDLFAFSPLVGSGLPLFTPRGTLLRRLLEEFVLSLQTPYGYERVWIPHITKAELYKTSGHWDKFEDDLFHVSSKKSDEQFVLKPMNCPHHTQIFASRPRSYRDLPLRFAEVTTVYRDENTGQLQGLSRVRSITQDDAHMFCRPDQTKREMQNVYNIITGFYKAFGMSLRVRLSVRDPEHPEKYLGGDAAWQNAETALKELLAEEKLDYTVGLGEAAFYGPKLDFIAKDAIGREWQLATIQLDFNQPERFGLVYMDSDGQEKRPVMIHRAILGSIERFLGILIEHYAGAFPTWLAPVQVAVVPVGEKHLKVCTKLAKTIAAAGIRVEVDTANETVGYKIRRAEKLKVPYMLVVGDKEAKSASLMVRLRGQKDVKKMAMSTFLKRVTTENSKRK